MSLRSSGVLVFLEFPDADEIDLVEEVAEVTDGGVAGGLVLLGSTPQ